MSDPYSNHQSGLESPASDAFDITPDDGVALVSVTRALYVGAPGDVAVTMKSGASVIFKDVPGGSVLPVRATMVGATGTSAGNLVGLA